MNFKTVNPVTVSTGTTALQYVWNNMLNCHEFNVWNGFGTT